MNNYVDMVDLCVECFSVISTCSLSFIIHIQNLKMEHTVEKIFDVENF